MKAEALDRRITLQRFTSAQDETGQVVETWADLVTVSASWRRASARETLAAAEVSAAVTDVFEIRYDSAWSDLNPKDRLVYHGNTYTINDVTEIPRLQGFRIGASTRAD